MVVTWSSDHSTIYRNLQLRQTIVNDLSLAIGSSRIDQKVTLMQLGVNSTSINVMHNQEL
jgi:predicted XRE-type DNA-binding protein